MLAKLLSHCYEFSVDDFFSHNSNFYLSESLHNQQVLGLVPTL